VQRITFAAIKVSSTSLTFYELAQLYPVQLIIVYERDNSLRWLISRETIMEQMGIKGE